MSAEVKEEETVIGIHKSGIELQEGLNTSTSRSYCSNCRKNIHCYVYVDKESKEATIEKTCTNESCKCKCRTHYACRSCGMLHPYGINSCTRIEPKPVKNIRADREIDEINASWNKLQADKKQNMPEIKRY